MLTGNNILLRALEPSDVDLLYRWENDLSIWKVSNTLTPYSRHILEAYVANAHQDIYTAKQLRLIICCVTDNVPVGCIDLFDFDPTHRRAGIGILISEEKERKKGYASEALALLIQYAFSTLSLHQLYCNIAQDNQASIKLFQKHGFMVTGTKLDWVHCEGRWLNEYLLQLLNKNY